MKFNLFILLICFTTNNLLAQLEIEGSIGYDLSLAQIDEVGIGIGSIPQQMDTFGSIGIGVTVYSRLNKNTSIGFGLAAFQERTFAFNGTPFSINPINRFLFNELKLSLGVKQMFLKNCFFKVNASLYSLNKPKVGFSSDNASSLIARRAFLGPEIRLGYIFKNIFIEVYGFSNATTFSDSSDEVGLIIDYFNSFHKSISLGFNLGYKFNYPNKKVIERKIKEKFGEM